MKGLSHKFPAERSYRGLVYHIHLEFSDLENRSCFHVLFDDKSGADRALSQLLMVWKQVFGTTGTYRRERDACKALFRIAGEVPEFGNELDVALLLQLVTKIKVLQGIGSLYCTMSGGMLRGKKDEEKVRDFKSCPFCGGTLSPHTMLADWPDDGLYLRAGGMGRNTCAGTQQKARLKARSVKTLRCRVSAVAPCWSWKTEVLMPVVLVPPSQD